MKTLNRLGLAVIAAAALTALLAPGASATTLEVGGVTKNSSVTLVASLKSGVSIIIRDTFGFSSKTCTTSQLAGSSVEPYTGTTVTIPLTTVEFTACSPAAVTFHKNGTLHIAHIGGTTNGTVTWTGAEFTTSSPFGTLTCVTGEGVHLGTLMGISADHATINVNATLPCSGISSKLIATYIVTSPTGLGVSA